MTPFDATFQMSCQSLAAEARRLLGRRYLARRRDGAPAGGTEVTGHSDYVTGDEFRHIDWNLCARHDELRTRRYQGSEEHHVSLLLDCSASMAGSNGRKFDFARRLAAGLGYLALANLDSLSLATFSDRTLAMPPPLRGLHNSPRLLRFLSGVTCGEQTNLRRCIEQFAAKPRRRGMAVVVSDMLDEAGCEGALDLLRLRGYEPFVVQVVEPVDARPQFSGPVSLVDAEEGILRCTLEPADLANYHREFAAWCDSIRAYCRRYSLGYAQVESDESPAKCLYRLIRGASSRLLFAPVG